MPSKFMTSVIAQFLLLSSFCESQWTSTPFNSPSLPIAVRSPYLNSWLQQGRDPSPANRVWPYSWQQSVTSWYASVRVDGKTCEIFGQGNIEGTTPANQTSAIFTPSQTTFILDCFNVTVNATFLSPIFNNDLVRQSAPFSYFSVTVASADELTHSIAIYSDVTGEWLSGDMNKNMTWSADGVGDGYIILSTQLQDPMPFGEIADKAQDSTLYYAVKSSPESTYYWTISDYFHARLQFTDDGILDNSAQSNFCAINDNWPVLGAAVDFGNATTGNIVWTIGLVRSPAVQYINSQGHIEERKPYFLSEFRDQLSAVRYVVDSFEYAMRICVEFDAQITIDALQYSQAYAELLALSARQAFSALEITILQNSNGTWDTSDVKAFMKNMGSVGVTGGVNAVDVLYAAFPMYLYLDPNLGGYLLKPLLEFQDSGLYHLPYAAQNIGSTYPNATADGLDREHQLGVEESANMIIMVLAHAQASGNGELIGRHYGLLKNWTDYLVNTTLYPVDQLSPDEQQISSSNMTNVALKGILGIAAMGKISGYAGAGDDAGYYTGIAQAYIQQWASLAVAADGSHILMTYGEQTTSGLLYNLYADKLLRLNLVAQEIYDTQTIFLNNQSLKSPFGVPLDNSDSQFSRTDWMILSAAAATHNDARNLLIEQIHDLTASNASNKPFCAAYDPSSGLCKSGQNSPAQGAMFALLALSRTIAPSINISTSTTQPLAPRKIRKVAIIYEVAAGVFFLFLLVGGLVHCFKRFRHHTASTECIIGWVESSSVTTEEVQPSNLPKTISEKDELRRIRYPEPVSQHRHQGLTPPLSIACSGAERRISRSAARELNDVIGAGSNLVELRDEMLNIRRELDRIREGEIPPPVYDGPE